MSMVPYFGALKGSLTTPDSFILFTILLALLYEPLFPASQRQDCDIMFQCQPPGSSTTTTTRVEQQCLERDRIWK